MEEDSKAYLGTGWGFPPTFDQKARSVRLVSAETDICESLQILLSTSFGERVMQPNYGCNLQDLLFESLTPTVTSSIKELVRTAILYYEPRVRLKKIDIKQGLENLLPDTAQDFIQNLRQQEEERSQGFLQIIVDCIIISTNSRFNFVYPFYLQEGSSTLVSSAPGIAIVVNS
ncbi:hypothetical protein F7734_37835 [Scytonema sp. UIC 10036]|uniref:GPW/gp25 family protein n=1 Tax=Scytonema sp. UIC 10036 TaxID=2304196 RepID=UPI0012DA3396|nr:GPW/gp25 family protein [Scytonema sp. UIC 10036]MUG97764.1 hypothetical protein [Scytonema sp. UIC 10036]